MNEMKDHICPLPVDVAFQIKSSHLITSLQDAVLGLVENSLDAGSDKICIDIRSSHGSCTVEDNGTGIQPFEFGETGGLASRYCSCKQNDLWSYGRYGLFLASLGASSILKITSHHYKHDHPATLTIHHSRIAARSIPAPQHEPPLMFGHGTRVSVHNLFGNLPVRVKQRTQLHAEREDYSIRTFGASKKRLVALVLAWHRPIRLMLQAKDLHSRRLAIDLRSESDLARETPRDDIVFSPRLICRTLTQASYLDPSEWNWWMETAISTDSIKIAGLISLEPAPSKNMQFMSLNRRPLRMETMQWSLYDDINDLFASSAFGNRDDVQRPAEMKSPANRAVAKTRLKGLGKSIDRWPKFYIRIDINEDDVPRVIDQTAPVEKIAGLLKVMISKFLEEHKFIRHAKRAPGNELRSEPDRMTAVKLPPAEDVFAHLSRIKSSKPQTRMEVSDADVSATERPKSIEETLEGRERPEVHNDDLSVALATTVDELGQELDKMIAWQDPQTSATYSINSRTGLVQNDRKAGIRRKDAGARLDGPRKYHRHSTAFGHQQDQSWIRNLLAEWENPVFTLTESRIPMLTKNESTFGSIHSGHDTSHSLNQVPDTTGPSDAALIASLGRLSKESMGQCNVIRQVDKKFILIATEMTDGSRALVLVDQHAADERIRIEALLDDYRTQQPLTLEKPLRFDIPEADQSLLATYKNNFRQWGIHYGVVHSPFTGPQHATAAKTHIHVTAVPPAIAERCRAEPATLIELLRKEAWKLHERHAPPSTSSSPTTQKVQTMPPDSILELLNSRACRSSIMFNDTLSRAECEELVRRLARTKLPFVCAHGRPSVVPIVSLGRVAPAARPGTLDDRAMGFRKLSPPDDAENERGDFMMGEAFGDAWRRWRRQAGQ